MEKLTARLDLSPTRPIPQTTQLSATAFARSDSDPSHTSTHSPPLTSTQTQTNSTSSSGSFNDICYSSPQKKKIRSPGEPTESADQEMQLSDSESEEDDSTTITSVASQQEKDTKLNKRLFSQKEPQKRLASIFNKASKTGTSTPTNAPPITQYTNKSDLDGAKPI